MVAKTWLAVELVSAVELKLVLELRLKLVLELVLTEELELVLELRLELRLELVLELVLAVELELVLVLRLVSLERRRWRRASSWRLRCCSFLSWGARVSKYSSKRKIRRMFLVPRQAPTLSFRWLE